MLRGVVQSGVGSGGEQRQKAIDVPQRSAQIVGNGIGERFQLLHAVRQLRIDAGGRCHCPAKLDSAVPEICEQLR